MFETVGVMAVSACILQMVYEKIEKQRPVVDYTEENKKFREQKEQEAKEWSVQILPYLEKEKEQRSEPPVICVEDLTMRFRIATNNVSGIKEYLIQTLRKQMSYKELYALNHINFNVYRGEIVGVIGTNGSGKSTLLKIVSGALNPTSGRVVVDQRKVQLLTLGTGFDFELSAKENVYLNGAIIGYSKAFIDEHYQEIVDFAELEGFMEEKVKNFSSGMVSRLGFSIATVAGAAAILIPMSACCSPASKRSNAYWREDHHVRRKNNSAEEGHAAGAGRYAAQVRAARAGGHLSVQRHHRLWQAHQVARVLD